MTVQKKICMIGTFSVGKTSLVRRFVYQVFSETYQTSIGTTIEKKIVALKEGEVTMVLWDLVGDDRYQRIRMTYLHGMHGYLLVADTTRRQTYDAALGLQAKIAEELGDIPFIFVLNKSDLPDQREIDPDAETVLTQRGWSVLNTSAKTGEGVERAFMQLAIKMMSR